MPGSVFDTNILAYLASGDPAKADRAAAIVRDGGAISVQVPNELTNVARRKMRMTWPEIHAFLSVLRGLLTVQAIGVETHETRLAFAERYHLSTYDAMIAASAVHPDCDILWPEDIQHGMVFGGRLRIVNPFRGPARLDYLWRHTVCPEARKRAAPDDPVKPNHDDVPTVAAPKRSPVALYPKRMGMARG